MTSSGDFYSSFHNVLNPTVTVLGKIGLEYVDSSGKLSVLCWVKKSDRTNLYLVNSCQLGAPLELKGHDYAGLNEITNQYCTARSEMEGYIYMVNIERS